MTKEELEARFKELEESHRKLLDQVLLIRGAMLEVKRLLDALESKEG